MKKPRVSIKEVTGYLEVSNVSKISEANKQAKALYLENVTSVSYLEQGFRVLDIF